VVAYKVDEFYAPASDSGLIWNDPTLAIDWPVAREAVLSDKDKQRSAASPIFKSPFTYEGA
jgi:dTDP-4-dehydrorhamnose 3,5-epimerase